MKLKDILKTVASGAISALVPGGPAIVSMLNGVLGDDNQLPADATGVQAQNAIATLSTADKASVLNKQYDVEIEEIRAHRDIKLAMENVDATGNSTRPKIALDMSRIVCFSVIATVSLYCYAVAVGDKEMIEAITGGWGFVLAVISIPAGIVNSYFNKRTKEKQQKYEIAGGVKPPMDLIGSLISRVTGK